MLFITILLTISFSSTAEKTKALCEIPDFYKRYFDLKDLYSFSDESFSAKSALKAKTRLAEKKSPIPENDLNIVKGGTLQAELVHTKELFRSANGDLYELEINYLEAKIKYCEFILNTRLVDW